MHLETANAVPEDRSYDEDDSITDIEDNIDEDASLSFPPPESDVPEESTEIHTRQLDSEAPTGELFVTICAPD